MPSTRTAIPTAAQARADLRREWRRVVRTLGGTLLLLWAVLIVDAVVFRGQLWQYGIRPRTLTGLRGVLFAPFLHGGILHLLANSLSFLILGALVLFREVRWFWIVTAVGAVVGGLGTWMFGGNTIHIGFSGVLFAYFGYLLLAGVFERRLGSVVLSTFVALVLGAMLFGVLPGQPGISWESHLFGFIAGALAARLLASRSATRVART